MNGKRVLIIEDDSLIGAIYQNRFLAEKYEVEIAVDGETGVTAAQKFKPDAVILDLLLPGMSGVNVISKLRAQPEFVNLPIVVFTNTYLMSVLNDARKAGATYCVSKSTCTPKQLMTMVAKAINGGSSENRVAPEPGKENLAALSPEASGAEEASLSEVKQRFLDTAPATISAMRLLLQGASREKGPEQATLLDSMFRHARSISSQASVTGLLSAARLADAFEALLKELCEKPQNVNPSTLRTLASAVDFMGALLEPSRSGQAREPGSATILVVDDEPISRRAVALALERARLRPIKVDSPQTAYDLSRDNRFDLLFLDVDMPGMDGYELCAKIRLLPGYQTTPIVFVTGLTGLEDRAQSMISGGNDFIAKPFLSSELAVKALVFLLR